MTREELVSQAKKGAGGSSILETDRKPSDVRIDPEILTRLEQPECSQSFHLVQGLVSAGDPLVSDWSRLQVRLRCARSRPLGVTYFHHLTV